MSKILVLTDSLGLPRDIPEEVLYENTWPSKLADKYNILQSSIGGGTSYDLYKQSAYLKMYKPNLIIMQVGIVDCAPRVLTFHENIIGNYFWLTRKFLNLIIPRFGTFIRNFRQVSYYNALDFEKNLKLIKDFFPDSNFFVLGILPASSGYETYVPGISKKIRQYNDILKRQFGNDFIDLDDIEQACIMSDYHHLNNDGHQFVFDRLVLHIGNKSLK